jgi:Glycosyl hydrolase family 26
VNRRTLLGLAALGVLPAAGCGRRRPLGPNGADQDVDAPPPSLPAPVTAGGGVVPIKPGRVRLGAYLALQGLSPSAALALRRRQLGRDPSVLQRFYRWTDPLTAPALPARTTLMMAWGATGYSAITSGRSDKLIAAAARRVAARDEPTLLRWGWDMNRDFYRWGGSANGRNPAGYVASWRRVRRIFTDEGADNVSWVWSPNANSHPDAPWNTIADYYPGDAAVDWVGVSGYADRQTPEDMFDAMYDAYGGRKPIMLTEVAVADHGGRTKADWIIEFASWVKTRPAIGAVVWFDTDTHPGSAEKWRIDSPATALAAFRAMADDPAFGG